MCVCSEGTNPNRPFPDLNTGASSLTLYEPNQFVLGHGTWMEGGSYFQTNRPEPILENGALGYNRYSDTPPGNLCRITVPLSKRLNPGDSIYMVYYAKRRSPTSSPAPLLKAAKLFCPTRLKLINLFCLFKNALTQPYTRYHGPLGRWGVPGAP